MGIAADTIKLLFVARKQIADTWQGIKVCEFGNQRIRKNTVSAKTGKEYMTRVGAVHVSIDLNGKDGALKMDLSKPVSGIGEPFDVVTNYGTIEHVTPNQYWPFCNMHNLVRVGGVMVHVLPPDGHWKNHGDYHYNIGFIGALADANNYEIIHFNIVERKHKRNLICAVLKKTTDRAFMTEEQFNAMGLIYA